MAMIQYPNETTSFAQGVDTGQKLGGMWGKKENVPNIPMNDPGQMPQIDINQLTQQEQADTAKLKDIEKFQKNLTNDMTENADTFELQQASMKDIKSPVIQKMYQAGLSSQKIDSFMKAISTNPDPTSTHMVALKNSLPGKDKDPAWIALNGKIAEIQGIKQKAINDWTLKARNALLDLNDIELNPNKYSYKGQINDSVAKFMQNVPNYIPTLANTSPENRQWVEEYLKNREARHAGSSSTDKSIVFRGYNTKTKSWETWRGYSPQDWMRENSNMDKATIQPSAKSGEFPVNELIRSGKDNPDPFKEGSTKNKKPLTEKIRDKFLSEAKGDTDKEKEANARQSAIDAGYDVRKVVK
jgi:hypothetical protein